MKCPFCAEIIKKEAIICWHCKTSLIPKNKLKVKSADKLSVQNTVPLLGSIALGLGLVSIVMPVAHGSIFAPIALVLGIISFIVGQKKTGIG